MKSFSMFWFMIAVAGIVALGAWFSHAQDPLIWQTPYGTIGLPFSATDALVGYDAVTKQAIAGASLPFYVDPHSIISVNLGAVAPWPDQGKATIQPYISASHNLLREIPSLARFQSLAANIFARYITDQGKAGVGLAFSYAFYGGS